VTVAECGGIGGGEAVIVTEKAHFELNG